MNESATLATADPMIRLRMVTLPDDVSAAVAWYQDPEALYFSQGDASARFDAAMVEKMFSIMTTRCEVYIIEVHDSAVWRPVGDAALCQTAGTPITIGHAHDRSRGIGRTVLARLIQRAKELGWSEMLVSGVFTDNIRARRLYEGAGFEITGEIPAGDDRRQWTMRLSLETGHPADSDHDR